MATRFDAPVHPRTTTIVTGGPPGSLTQASSVSKRNNSEFSIVMIMQPELRKQWSSTAFRKEALSRSACRTPVAWPRRD